MTRINTAWWVTVSASTVIAILSGCSPSVSQKDSGNLNSSTQQSTREPIPVPDMRSPDTVVKSRWALSEWLAKNPEALIEMFKLSRDLNAYCEVQKTIISGDAVADLEELCNLEENMRKDLSISARDTTSREIISVTNESDTRAIVLARILNTTPIPSDVKFEKEDAERREFGREVRYIVEKGTDGWRLTGAYSRDTSSMRSAKLLHSDGPALEREGWEKSWKPKSNSSTRSTFAYAYPPPP